MKADLHMHSVYSDGLLTPAELARLAKEAGLGLVSVTDHDNLAGLEEKRRAVESEGLLFVGGWEISAYDGVKIHVLGYRCALGRAYDEFLGKRIEGGLLRANDMLEKANAALGLDVTMDEVEANHVQKDTPVHTMHVVRAFAKRLNAEVGALYNGLFTKGKPAYSDLGRPSPGQAIEVIHRLGGIAVLAHPGRIDKSLPELEKLLRSLADNGLDGIECHYTTHTVEETETFIAFARELGLLRTGGSDFHFFDGRHVIGKPDFTPDDALLDALKLPLGGN